MKALSCKHRQGERGNALFLILIAVALFAALSYAVTQSGRGSGSIDREQGLINAAQLTQYPSAIRTAATRLILTGTAATAVDFDATSGGDAIFSPTGGGVTAQTPPSTAVVGTACTDDTQAAACNDWRFKAETPSGNVGGWYIEGVNGSALAATNRDAFAFLGVTTGTCNSINTGLGVTLGFQSVAAVSFATPTDGTEGIPGTQDGGAGASTAGVTGTATTISGAIGEPFACYSNATNANGPFVYYHAIVEQ